MFAMPGLMGKDEDREEDLAGDLDFVTGDFDF